ncbi:hypothetical protein [Croceivirga thetidis]|uniref:Uncharacterized protein n=1 Tax=Croceivirga thetidis TaxID=2721623 RepID=A0ABX1GTD3_9FLAO|nr:hypothetical protein [Croceivirga thetidis]NKI32271.1 hypothetical protein [Croceivirga thetidis]
MNTIKLVISVTLLLLAINAPAQELPNEGTTEVTEKTFTMKNGEETIENSVRITTSVKQAVMIDKNNNDVNRKRIYPPKLVVKTVEIDNDTDNLYDEKIEFSYLTNERTDFTLISSEEDIMLVVEEGENVTVLENQRLFKTNQDNRTTYVYTSEDGDKIEFRIEKSPIKS